VVAYIRLSLAAGSSSKAAHQGKSKGQPEREGRRKGKKIVFYTSEANILLKTQVEPFEKGQNKLIFRSKLAPKCAQKPRFLPIPDLICTPKGPNYRGLHGVSNPFGQAEIHPGCREALWSSGKDADPAMRDGPRYLLRMTAWRRFPAACFALG
jgi:hypothetical protein